MYIIDIFIYIILEDLHGLRRLAAADARVDHAAICHGVCLRGEDRVYRSTIYPSICTTCVDPSICLLCIGQ